MRRRISMRGCVIPSVHPSARPPVRPSVCLSVTPFLRRVLGASCAVCPAMFLYLFFLLFFSLSFSHFIPSAIPPKLILHSIGPSNSQFGPTFSFCFCFSLDRPSLFISVISSCWFFHSLVQRFLGFLGALLSTRCSIHSLFSPISSLNRTLFFSWFVRKCKFSKTTNYNSINYSPPLIVSNTF